MNGKFRLEILVVDDDADFREALAHRIERLMGYRPHQAANGRQAHEHIQNQPTHVLITDTNLPEMNGVDLLLNVKDHNPQLKVIVLFSGLRGSEIDEGDLMRLGAFMVLKKAEIQNRLYPLLRAFAVGQIVYNALRVRK